MLEIAGSTSHPSRVTAAGKFLQRGNAKLLLRGVTYGPFRPTVDGEYGSEATVAADFARMEEAGVNAVRCYTVPPRWLLDTALEFGLSVWVGLPWEQHIAFLDDRRRRDAVVRSVVEGARGVAGHPALLGFAIGNEIPAPIVRWQGAKPTETFLRRLYESVKDVDPNALVTYVNYPTTEYLELPFLDFLSFNVYLEKPETLRAYLSRLHNLSADRPLVLAEIGLCSRAHGAKQQGKALEWQLRTVYALGCAGSFVFAWTDEWHRGGHDITDWDFGITDREHKAKPALEKVRRVFLEAPFPTEVAWPRVSVVVCSYNGSRTIRDTLEALAKLDYPDYEVIVIDDGSKDTTAAIAAQYDVRLVSTPNRGLSAARNLGLQRASGEIVAYTDDDAYPDPQWLKYLCQVFLTTEHAGVGGPNIPPPGDGPIAECVARSPGGPAVVLTSDTVAEHIPGCNMAFRREALSSIGGFDVRFRTAGDDVDVCWRLQERGFTLGYSPAAMVWHHRRNSARMYWRQQVGYGRAEAMLEAKWPERYNALGHVGWSGRIYGDGLTQALLKRRGRVYQGVWGSAPFQSIYEPAPDLLSSIPLMPEWYFVLAGLAVISCLSIAWTPAILALPLLGVALALTLAQAWQSSRPARRERRSGHGSLRLITALFHLLQPLARLTGRLRHGLSPWRRRGIAHFTFPAGRVRALWSEKWQEAATRLSDLERCVRDTGAVTHRGGNFDHWDLEIRGGLFGGARTRLAIEEHGAGRQLIRCSLTPCPASATVASFSAGLALALAAVATGATAIGALFAVTSLALAWRVARDCAGAIAVAEQALARAVVDGIPLQARSGAGRGGD